MVVVDGAPLERDFLDGIDVQLEPAPGGAAVDSALQEALHALTPSDSSSVVPALLKARALIAAIDHPEARLKLREVDETIAQAMGVLARCLRESRRSRCRHGDLARLDGRGPHEDPGVDCRRSP